MIMDKKKILKWLMEIRDICFICADDPQPFGYKESDYIDLRIGKIRNELKK